MMLNRMSLFWAAQISIFASGLASVDKQEGDSHIYEEGVYSCSIKFDSTCQEVFLKENYAKFKEAIISMKKSCGTVCDTGTSSDLNGKYYKQIWKNIDCQGVFDNPYYFRESEFESPLHLHHLPHFMKDELSHFGKVQLDSQYINNKEGLYELEWTEERVQELRNLYKNGSLVGLYSKENVDDIVNHLENYMEIKGKHVLVIGTQMPWIEAILLELGADQVTTLEYVHTKSHHPKLKTIRPKEFAEKYLNGTLGQFDAMVTFSSIEHSGLGGYGDALNPWEDLLTMARSWCTLRPKSRALVGVPSGGPDIIDFNSLRVYGPFLYSQLFANWCQIHRGPILHEFDNLWRFRNQPVHVVEKISEVFEEMDCFDFYKRSQHEEL